MISKALAAAVLLLAAVGCAPPAPETARPVAEAPVAAALEPLEVHTAQGVRRFRVEVADDPAERERGLMYRTLLADDEGMIFDFGQPQMLSFWMKNTLIPLDIIFIGADGRIINIAENTTPLSLEPVPSAAPGVAVLEIAGGRSAELGIRPGDRVMHRTLPQ